MKVYMLLVTCLLMTACGGSASGGASTDSATANLETMTSYYENGQIASVGHVDDEGLRQEQWRSYFADGQLQFQGYFKDHQLDESRTWVEYNQDASVRFDSSDGAYPITLPFAE